MVSSMDEDKAPLPSRRIAEDLRRAIAAGKHGPGEKLPSERELAEQYGTARNTAREAIRLLLEQGLVTAEHGRGVFVRQRPPVRRIAMDRYRADQQVSTAPDPQTSFTKDQDIAWSDYRLDRDYSQVRAGDELADLFELAPDTQLLRRHFVFWARGVPSQISINYLPWEIVGGTPVADPDNEPWPGGTLDQCRSLGYPITRVEESVTSRMPTTEEATTLQMAAGTPVLTITRRLLSNERAMEVCKDIVLPADQVILDYAIDL